MSRPYLTLVLVPVRALSLPHVLVLLLVLVPVLVPVPVRALSLPLSGVSVLSPGERDLLSPGKVLSSPGKRDLLSPGHRDLLSPGHRDLLSPGKVISSPGERDLLSPGHRDLLSPGKVLSSPGELDLLSPGHREVLVPVWPGPPGGSGMGVRTSCEQNRMRVSVSRGALGPAGAAPPTHLRLGTCAVSRSTEDQIHFEYDLNQCGTRRAMISDRLVYFNLLHYAPPAPPRAHQAGRALQPPGGVLLPQVRPPQPPTPQNPKTTLQGLKQLFPHRHSSRTDQTPKLQTPKVQTPKIQTPDLQTPRTSRPMKLTGQPTLTPCNALWEELSELDHYVLGEPVYFEARVPPSPRNQRLYVHSCHVTPERPPAATPRLPLVGNNGCLLRNEEDEGGCSRFFPSSKNAVRFSVDAFLFQGTNGRQLQLHCALSVGGPQPTPAAKACHYLPHAHRWVEVDGPDSVCACCESQCSPAPPTETRWVSSRPWTVLEPPPQGRAPPTAGPGGAWPFRGRGVTWVEEGEQTKGWAIVEEEEEEEEEEEDPHRMFEGDFVFGK
ncbi:zona pellucida sperm-binding protein 3-like [Menidia menidia]